MQKVILYGKIKVDTNDHFPISVWICDEGTFEVGSLLRGNLMEHSVKHYLDLFTQDWLKGKDKDNYEFGILWS